MLQPARCLLRLVGIQAELEVKELEEQKVLQKKQEIQEIKKAKKVHSLFAH